MLLITASILASFSTLFPGDAYRFGEVFALSFCRDIDGALIVVAWGAFASSMQRPLALEPQSQEKELRYG